MQLRRSILLALCIVLFIYFEIHSCSGDRLTTPEPIPPADGIICSATDVYFHDFDFGCVVGSLGTLILTADGGKTWKGTVIDEGALNDVQFIDRATGWIAGKDETVLRTDDGGSSWTLLASSGFPRSEDILKITFFDRSVGYALGYHGVYRTEDGGVHWVNNWLPDEPYRGAWDMSFADDRNGYLLGSQYTDPDPSILYRTKDGGASWSRVEGSKSTILRTVLAISFIDELTGWAGGGVILKTTDGGETWMTQVATATIREFHFLSKDYGFAVGGKTILRTRDGGSTWENLAPADVRIKDLRSVHFLDENNGWVVGRAADEVAGGKTLKHSILLRTKDGGATWTIRDFAYDYTGNESLEETQEL